MKKLLVECWVERQQHLRDDKVEGNFIGELTRHGLLLLS
jgi:hypothetical protein